MLVVEYQYCTKYGGNHYFDNFSVIFGWYAMVLGNWYYIFSLNSDIRMCVCACFRVRDKKRVVCVCMYMCAYV